MARVPKPWYWKQRKVWCVYIDGKKHILHPDREEAHRLFHAIMAKPPEEGHATVASGSVMEITEAFMDYTKLHRAAATYEWYQKRLDRFIKIAGVEPVTSLRPFHVQQWLDKQTWGDAYKAGMVTAIKRVFNWSVEQGYIDHSPLHGLKKPDPGRREQTISQEEFDEALSCVPNTNFHDIARFVWFTGCRPEEAVKITRKMVDLSLSRIIVPRLEAKKKKRPRVIYLCDEAREIVERNMGNSPTLFLNTKGRPWTAYAIANTWGRIEKKTGKRYCTYSLRHSYATDQLKAGTDPVTLATLLGHQDTSMLAKVYANLSQDPEYLRKTAARRKNGGS